MRTSTGLRLFFAIATAASLTAAFIACGGSDDNNTDVTTPPDAGNNNVFEASVQETSPPPPSEGGAGNGDAGRPHDSGTPVVLDGGPGVEGGIACVAGGTVEEEPNNVADAANVMDPADADCSNSGCSRCGVISGAFVDAGADASAAAGVDPEYLYFMLKPSTTEFFVQYAGDVTLTLSVEGQPDVVIGGPATPGSIAFVANKNYYILVKPNQAKQTPWRVTVFEY